jgi:hypothetical protein
VTYVPHSDLPDPQSSSPLVEQISYMSPLPLEITPSSSEMLQATMPSAQTAAPPSKVIILNPPTDGQTSLIPLATTSPPPQMPGSTAHPPASVTATLASPSAGAASQSTDEGTALIFRLCNHHVPPADITRIVAIMNGRDQTTVEEVQLLRRLNNLNVPAEDINLIVDAMQRRDRSSGFAHDDIAPPGYDSIGR